MGSSDGAGRGGWHHRRSPAHRNCAQPDGGALAKQLPLFKFGLGGRFGSGRQWQSWISIDDEIGAIEHLLTAGVAGPVNLTAPAPVTNAEFTDVLARVLRRPHLPLIPSIGPKVLYGSELVENLLLTGQRVVPATLEESGYVFAPPGPRRCVAPTARALSGIIREGRRQRMTDVAPNFEAASDAALAIAISRYEQSALAEAYKRHAGAVFALARRLLVDQALAEEVVQEVFLRLWNDPTRFDPDRGSLRSFLLIDAHGRAVDSLRSDASRREREDRDARKTAANPYDLEYEAGDLVVVAKVRNALEHLPDDERAAIEVAYFGGYTYREVAARLDVPEGTVKSRIRSGLRRLHRELVAAGVEVGT